jgi:hypothetical protein
MKKHLLVALAAVFVVGIAASAAHAQCAFEHPKKAGKLQSNLVQAFVSCGNPGGNTSNGNTTEGGVPACKPPETYSQKALNDSSGGWKWDELSAQGKLSFQAKKACTGKTSPGAPPPCSPSSPLNQGPPPSADLAIKLQLKGILQGPGAGTTPATGSGILATVARATLEDRMNGDMTVVDFPAGFGFAMTDGKAKLQTSADALLNGIGQPGLPPCTSIEVVTIRVIDSKGDTFAVMGTYLPKPS